MNPPCLLKLPSAKYHLDQIGADRPSLSSSIAGTLVNRCPAHAWNEHPKFGAMPRESTPAMARGTLIHSLVLEPDDAVDQIVIVEADSYRTLVAKEARDQAVRAGKTPILVGEIAEANRVADAIRTAIAKEGIRLSGISESVVVWEEETSSGKILCRGMIDHLDGVEIFDLKTCRSAHPDDIAAAITQHGYDIQWAAYTSALDKLYPENAGRSRFTWLFVEEMPGGRVIVTPARPDGMMRELGRSKWQRACETWARCLRTNQWPGYVSGIASITPRPWELKDELGEA